MSLLSTTLSPTGKNYRWLLNAHVFDEENTFSRENIGCTSLFLQAGHTEVANKTIKILAALEQVKAARAYLKMNFLLIPSMQIHSTHSTSTEKDVTIDGVDAVSESATVPTTTNKSGQSGTDSPSQGEPTSAGPTPSCSGSKVKKLKPGNITCTASSHYGPAWACRKVNILRVNLLIVLTLQHSGV